MILVTRLNGSPFAVNPDLLERVEPTPDTVLTLIDGTKYIVTESVTEIITLVREFRASVVVAARAVPREGLDEAADESAAALASRAHPHLQVAPAPADDADDADEAADPRDGAGSVELQGPALAAVPAPGTTARSHADPVTVGG